MIKYRLHENGWTVILENFDFKKATQDDINQIAKLLATNTIVVCKGQSLTIEDEVRIAKMFKNPQQYSIDDNMYDRFLVKGSERMALRVTGEKDSDDIPGVAGYTSEMVWHCNDPGVTYRKPIVYLYGVRGTKGSRTSWNNNILSYNDLPETVKNQIENFHIKVMLETSLNGDELDDNYTISDYNPPLVKKNIAGKKGLFFPFLQVINIIELFEKESRDFIDWLGPYTVQEKYCYHHDWEDGDVVLSEQNLGIHKRWPFKDIEKRLLHRMAFEFPDQDYKS